MSGRITLRQKFKHATTPHGAKIHAARIASVEYHRRNAKCIYTRGAARLLIAIAVALHNGDWRRAKRIYKSSPHLLTPMPDWIRDILRAPCPGTYTPQREEKKNTDTNNTAADNTIPACGLTIPAVAWARKHGSEYLRSCVEKGIWCRSLYNKERARLEAPGWSLLNEEAYRPSNPPAETMDLLARARERFPLARLRQIRRDHYVEFMAVARAPWPDGQKLIFDDILVVEDDEAALRARKPEPLPPGRVQRLASLYGDSEAAWQAGDEAAWAQLRQHGY